VPSHPPGRSPPHGTRVAGPNAPGPGAGPHSQRTRDDPGPPSPQSPRLAPGGGASLPAVSPSSSAGDPAGDENGTKKGLDGRGRTLGAPSHLRLLLSAAPSGADLARDAPAGMAPDGSAPAGAPPSGAAPRPWGAVAAPAVAPTATAVVVLSMSVVVVRRGRAGRRRSVASFGGRRRTHRGRRPPSGGRRAASLRWDAGARVLLPVCARQGERDEDPCQDPGPDRRGDRTLRRSLHGCPAPAAASPKKAAVQAHAGPSSYNLLRQVGTVRAPGESGPSTWGASEPP